MVLSDVWWFRYYSNGNIIALDSLIKQLDIKVDDFQKSLIADYQYEDKQWALPYGRSTPLFYYNKDHFKAAGLPDRAPKTWQEFAEWAPKLKASSGAQYAYIYPALAGYAGWTLQNNLWGWGGSWSNEWTFNCDSAESVAALQWAQDSIFKDKWAGVSSKEAADDFAAGHHLVHDFLDGFPAGGPEVREVQRGRRLPAGRSEERKPGVPHRRRRAWASPAVSARRSSSPPPPS